MTDALLQAPPTVPGDVIDAHTHVFTVGVLEEMLASMPPDAMPRFRQALKDRRFGRRGGGELPDMTPEACAAWYTGRMAEAGVARAVFMSAAPDNQWTREFIAAAKDHVHGFCAIDPREPGAADLLEREMAAGFKGVKLYPVNRCFRVSDPACRPFFEKAAELEVPITIHYGVTVDPSGDLRYADPLDLSPVARDFPKIPFVIAHFGAGWFSQLLQLGYQCKNVCLDTSGTNNWMDNYVPKLTLPDVFERALTAFGPERVLFGTDSGTTANYRHWIKFQQMRVIDELGLTDHDQDLLRRGNAVRLFKLHD